MPAANPVRKATTAKGENPCVMASFPKTGAMPRKIAELNAAKTPAVCLFTNIASLFWWLNLFQKRLYLIQEFIIEKIAFLQECLNVSTETVLFVGSKFFGGGNDHGNGRSFWV